MHVIEHEGLKAVTSFFADCLGANTHWLECSDWHIAQDGQSATAFFEDQEGNRYEATFAVTKTARVEQTMEATPRMKSLSDFAEDMKPVPRVSTSDDYDDKHIRSNT